MIFNYLNVTKNWPMLFSILFLLHLYIVICSFRYNNECNIPGHNEVSDPDVTDFALLLLGPMGMAISNKRRHESKQKKESDQN